MKQSRPKVPTPPPSPPTTSTLEECVLDALDILNNFDPAERDELFSDNGVPRLCPVPGCGKPVRKMWNHLHQYHRKKGLTGKFTSKASLHSNV